MTTPLPEQVDNFFAETKALAGKPQWTRGNRAGERELHYQILTGTRVSRVELLVKAYPFEEDGRFNLLMVWPPRIFGLDFEPNGGHTNPLSEALDPKVKGPHIHLWSDNRQYATHGKLPDELKVARHLEPKIRRIDQAFRWFCDKANIERPRQDQIPSYPVGDILL